MRNLYHYLLVLLLVALAGCSTTAPQLSSYELQLLRGASTAADRIERIDEESIVVTNNTVPADPEFLFKAIQAKSKTTSSELRQQLDQATDSYFLTAGKYCKNRGRQSGPREVIGQNSIRFTCFTYSEIAFYELKTANDFCNATGDFVGDKKYKRQPDNELTTYIGCHWPSDVCKEVERVFQGVERPTCGFVRKRMAEYQVAPVQPSAPAMKNNDLEPAKKKCRELGFAENTEKFGSCVLSLSN